MLFGQDSGKKPTFAQNTIRMFHFFIRYTFLIFLILASGIWLTGNLAAQDTTKIVLERADTWEYNEAIGPNVQRIKGDVVLRHDTGYLYCDSAYLNDVVNVVMAYGNVHIKASDTLNLYGDSLQYNGNTKIAKVWGNVKLIDNQTIVTTDSLDFNRRSQIAWYDNWGKIVNDENNLVSKYGYYYTSEKEFFFKEKVILINPDYIMNSDTLMYNTVTEIAYFYGPTTIVSKDKVDSIYCIDGWYDTRKDISRFRYGAEIYHQAQLLTGDTVYYERLNGFGQVYNNAMILDTVQHIALTGNYGEMKRKRGIGFMTRRATGILIEKNDSLFMHGDTIKAYFDPEEDQQKIRAMLAFYNVRFFRKDLQGACDSLVYHRSDSTIFMYHDPVIWSGKNQLTADTITLTIRNGELDTMVMYKSAFIISRDDTAKYNQIKGKDMIAYFLKNELYKIKVTGNSETIYFAREEDQTLIGINRLYASDMLIFVDDNDIHTITYIEKPTGTLYPENEISPYDLLLKNFKWREDQRPKMKEEIYR
ncbi:MAG: organic solvent tolerance protein OstA [Bacteroidetes bacterium]|nr:MAG: organic solvent tolerance protein OstA [Bacteroidota bacterium]